MYKCCICQAAECLTFSLIRYIRVALAPSDVQRTLEIPATDEIHMEDQKTMVLPELNRTMVYTTRNTVKRLACNELNLNPVVLERLKEE